MKTLKFFSIVLGLIILISFTACKDIKNPYAPDLPDLDQSNPGIAEITVDYTGSPVIATLKDWQVTLNWVKFENKLQNKFYPDVWYSGQFVVIELKVKNTGVTGLSIGTTHYQFTLVDGNNIIYPVHYTTYACFEGSLMIYSLAPGEETWFHNLVYDVGSPFNSTLVIVDNPTLPRLSIKFNLLTL